MSARKSEEVNESHKQISSRKHRVKDTVMKKLNQCKKHLLNDKTKTFQDLNIPLDIENSLAVEFYKKKPITQDPPQVQDRREEMVSLIQGLMAEVEKEGDKIVVVNVETPAVDLEKNFNSKELEFMKNDIFSSIQDQLGTDLPDEAEDQWSDAFQAMMSILDNHKQKARK